MYPLTAPCAGEATEVVGAPLAVDCDVADWMLELLDKVAYKVDVKGISLVYPTPPLPAYIEVEYYVPPHEYVAPGIARLLLQSFVVEFTVNGSRDRIGLELRTSTPDNPRGGFTETLRWYLAGTVGLYNYIPYKGGVRDVYMAIETCIFNPMDPYGEPVCPHGTRRYSVDESRIGKTIEWPKGQRLPHAVAYPLVREVWVLGGGRREIRLDARNTIPSGLYHGGPGQAFQEALEGPGIICYRLNTGYDKGEVYGCPPVVDVARGPTVGPFLLLVGSKTSWDPEEAVRHLQEVTTENPLAYALPPIAVHKERPAILIPLTYGGPLGIQYYRGHGMITRQDGEIIVTTGRKNLFRVEDDKLIPLNRRVSATLMEMARNSYRGEFRLTLWTIIDTPLGLRPGPPPSILEKIGFGGAG